jgi:hypothetical protein
MITKRILMLSIVLSVLSVNAQESLVDKVIALKGAEQEIAMELPKQMYGGTAMAFMMLGKQPPSAEEQAKTEAALKEKIRDVYEKHYDEATFKGMITWLESPTGKKITAIENQDIQAVSDDFNEDKKAAIDRFARDTDLFSVLKETVATVTETVLRPIMYASMKQKNKTDEEIDAFMASQEFLMMVGQQLSDEAISQELYKIYSYLTIDEVNAYTAYLKSEAGQKQKSISKEMIPVVLSFLGEDIAGRLK